MLKKISPVLSPDLLKMLCEMGHGDEICIADANFPALSYANNIVRADGHSGTDILAAVLDLIPLDQYAESNCILMQVVPGDTVQTPIWDKYKQIAKQYDKNARFVTIDKFAFYNRVKSSVAVIATGEKALYANIMLKKGVL